jgi:cellobiose phosphorylase
MRTLSVFAVLLFLISGVASANGKWAETADGLPYCKYESSRIPGSEDPYFLLGNYRFKVFTHVSGIYELISGERNWARFNADPATGGYGSNVSSVSVDGRDIRLVGQGSMGANGKCEVYSGVGYTRYVYDLGDGLECSRMISVMPSEEPGKGNPFFLLTVTFRNSGSGARKVSYEEAVSPCFVPMNMQSVPDDRRSFKYLMNTDVTFRCVTASFLPVPDKFVNLPSAQSRSIHEVAPQGVFMYCPDAFLVVNQGMLKASFDDFRLRPGNTRTLQLVIGLADADCKTRAEEVLKNAENGQFGAFASMWKARIPDFSSERNKTVRRELYRKAHLIEASAVYNDYFKETFIPGGSLYTYKFGENASNRHHIHSALQACTSNPSLAKSIIRYVMKQTSFDGMIPNGNKGFGVISSDSYSENNLQLEVMNAVTEYLQKTGDYAFLDEWIASYPTERLDMIQVKKVLELYLLYLMDSRSVSPARLVIQASCLPSFMEQMETSGRMSQEYMDALRGFVEGTLKTFEADADNLDLSEAAYLLKAPTLSTSVKRLIVESFEDEGKVTYPIAAGYAAFDGIEASIHFRELTSRTAESFLSDDCTSEHIWALYCYYKMME